MKQNREPRNKPMHIWSKEARIYNGEKMFSSISGARKLKQLHVKE